MLSDPPGGFDSIQFWETYVQHNQVRFQFFSPLNGFRPIRCFADHLKFGTHLKQLTDFASPAFVIINYENAD